MSSSLLTQDTILAFLNNYSNVFLLEPMFLPEVWAPVRILFVSMETTILTRVEQGQDGCWGRWLGSAPTTSQFIYLYPTGKVKIGETTRDVIIVPKTLDSHWVKRVRPHYGFLFYENLNIRNLLSRQKMKTETVLINPWTISPPMSPTKHISPFQLPVFSLTLSHVPVTRMHLCPALPLDPSVGGWDKGAGRWASPLFKKRCWRLPASPLCDSLP